MPGAAVRMLEQQVPAVWEHLGPTDRRRGPINWRAKSLRTTRIAIIIDTRLNGAEVVDTPRRTPRGVIRGCQRLSVVSTARLFRPSLSGGIGTRLIGAEEVPISPILGDGVGFLVQGSALR